MDDWWLSLMLQGRVESGPARLVRGQEPLLVSERAAVPRVRRWLEPAPERLLALSALRLPVPGNWSEKQWVLM